MPYVCDAGYVGDEVGTTAGGWDMMVGDKWTCECGDCVMGCIEPDNWECGYKVVAVLREDIACPGKESYWCGRFDIVPKGGLTEFELAGELAAPLVLGDSPNRRGS